MSGTTPVSVNASVNTSGEIGTLNAFESALSTASSATSGPRYFVDNDRSLYFVSGPGAQQRLVTTIPEGWTPYLGNTFTGGQETIFFRNDTTGQTAAWRLNAGNLETGAFLVDVPLNSGWNVVDFADANADGIKDAIWYNSITGQYASWQIDPNSLTVAGAIIADPFAAVSANSYSASDQASIVGTFIDNLFRVGSGDAYGQAAQLANFLAANPDASPAQVQSAAYSIAIGNTTSSDLNEADAISASVYVEAASRSDTKSSSTIAKSRNAFAASLITTAAGGTVPNSGNYANIGNIYSNLALGNYYEINNISRGKDGPSRIIPG